MTAELCPTCGIWWRGVEHSCRLPISSTTTDFDPAWGAISKDEIQRLRAIEEAARDISRRTFVDDGVVAHVPFYKLYTLRQRLYGSDEEIIAALDALDGSE